MSCEEQTESTEERVTSLVASRDLEGWEVFIRSILKEISPSDASREAISCALRYLNEVARVDPAFPTRAAKTFLAASMRHSAAWSKAIFEVRGALAEWCMHAGDEEQAQELWRLMLPADNDMTSLQVLTKLVSSSLRTRSYATAETECLRGLTSYRVLSRQPEADDVVNAFLHAFASLLAVRNRFTEASQRFYELYVRTKDPSHLRAAIVCVVQADASATRSRLLGIFYMDGSEAILGELYNILHRAHHSYVLRPSDLQQFLPYVDSSSDVAAVEGAFIQHNLQAVSRMYYNIGFEDLGLILGIAPSDAERLVGKMVSERRLDASIDQTTETVVFCRPDNRSAMEAWNARIGSICEEMSHASDLITSLHAEFNEYLLLK